MNRKRSKITRNGKTLTVYPYGAAWRFCWREREGMPWRYVTRATKKAAEEAAWEKLGEIDAGGLVWSALDGEARRFLESVHRLAKAADFPAVLAFLESRSQSAEVVLSVARFLAWKVAKKGEKTRNLENVRRVLEPMAEQFKGRCLVDIAPAELAEWWSGRTAGRGKKTANEVRGALVGFYKWAVWDGIHPKVTTAADKLPRQELDKAERRVLRPQEVLDVLNSVQKEFRAWVVLGAFAGLRPEEIAPPQKKGMSKAGKRGIRCEEIDWRFSVIRLPAEVSKLSRNGDRLVPLTDAAKAWLAWAGIEEGMVGPVCLRNPSEQDELKRIGLEVFKGRWPQDALRHSFGSYRNAMLRNLPRVAEEMGTSVQMLQKHYHNPQTEEAGANWFSLRPGMIRFDPMAAGAGKDAEQVKPRRKAR